MKPRQHPRLHQPDSTDRTVFRQAIHRSSAAASSNPHSDLGDGRVESGGILRMGLVHVLSILLFVVPLSPEVFGQLPTDDTAAAVARVRFATFNVSLFRKKAGQLVEDLEEGRSQQAHQLAAIIQRVRPDVLLLNEFDFDASGTAAEIFCAKYLAVAHEGSEPITYAHRFFAPSNTGVPSGFDFDNNGRTDDPADCFGYGVYPGQYGMLVLSRFPILKEQVRTFQKFLWRDMPNAHLPKMPNGRNYYSAEELAAFRLSSKSHWDVPVKIGRETIHFLVCHPTPPVFDGPEDRNGKRNHDEIRFFADYIDPKRSDYVRDDQGQAGGLPSDAKFVIAGDLNADPDDGDSFQNAARQLTEHPLVLTDPTPVSQGGKEAGNLGVNRDHAGKPAHDTSDFDDRRTGNLRIDYCLPSRTLSVSDAGIFWPKKNAPESKLVQATDHRLVWIDINL